MNPSIDLVTKFSRLCQALLLEPPVIPDRRELESLLASLTPDPSPPQPSGTSSAGPFPQRADAGGVRTPSFRHAAPAFEPVTLSLEPFELVPPAEATPLDDDAEPPLPERYQYRSFIGAGGMGRVHRVYDRYLN